MSHVEPNSAVQNVGYFDGHFDDSPAQGRAVAVPMLLAGTLLTVHTRNTLYRIVVTDGPTRRVLVEGGRLFSRSTNAEVIGATDEANNLKVGLIVEGLRLELITDNGPVITSTVESLEVDVDPVTMIGKAQ